MNIKLEVEITDEQLHSVFTTALEGGIGYWSRARSYHWATAAARHPDDSVLVVAGVAVALAFQPEDDLLGFHAEVEESEEDDLPRHTINRQTIIQGLQRLADGTVTEGGQPWDRGVLYVAKIVRDDYDSLDADIVVQAGLFGDIKYG